MGMLIITGHTDGQEWPAIHHGVPKDEDELWTLVRDFLGDTIGETEPEHWAGEAIHWLFAHNVWIHRQGPELGITGYEVCVAYFEGMVQKDKP